ncbi:transmembrane protein 107 like isoform X1 [Chiloscyllium plagiosum]|uniref:transmembrane protein 107 like isoform X1 n=1 Tax=Chiloscyllium plagiosum TaxID=36176 RepID=UPI001CB82ACC|nr:transmembrane protein 107 like isoform X1 [Chiloscyllium plagiosum]XP_043532903.1 transmembrane protein 107 like isoform X1 [Chiloscyllium plagiosum]
MPIPSSLIPSRFLTLMAHLVIVIDIFWSRENNVLASLPPTHTSLQYQNRDTELIVALSVTLGMFLIELLGFFSGVSMFNSTQSLISIGTHASASVTLLFFLFEQWPCSTYWWIFAFCSALPACIEIILMIGVFGLKKKPL